MSKLIYLFFCFFVDILLSSIFPVDYANVRLNFVSNMGIIGIMFISRDLDIKNSLLLAFVFGLFIDLTHYSYFLLIALSYTVTIFIMRNWSNQVNESIPEIIILGVLTIFVQNSIVFFIMRLLNLSSYSFILWVTHRQFMTLLGNIPIIVLAYFAYNIKNQFEIKKDKVRRRNEKTLWMKVSNPFE